MPIDIAVCFYRSGRLALKVRSTSDPSLLVTECNDDIVLLCNTCCAGNTIVLSHDMRYAIRQRGRRRHCTALTEVSPND